MAKPYSIDIINGSGQEEVVKGSYTATLSAAGYDTTTFDPTSVTISDESSYAFTVGATGTLTIHVTEEGTSEGTPVVGAVFYRTDDTGTTYGDSVTTDDSGNAVLNNVPFDTAETILIYYKQTASDGDHDFDDSVKNISLNAQTGTVEIQNTAATTKTFTLTDANYTGLPVAAATITLQ